MAQQAPTLAERRRHRLRRERAEQVYAASRNPERGWPVARDEVVFAFLRDLVSSLGSKAAASGVTLSTTTLNSAAATSSARTSAMRLRLRRAD